jgi:hypothetical protein
MKGNLQGVEQVLTGAAVVTPEEAEGQVLVLQSP